MINISIIIVNYNSGSYLEDCIKSIRDSLSGNYEIIVVDNCSNDKSIDFLANDLSGYENIKLINNSKNIGFAAANNVGVLHSSGRLLHFLNPDTIVNNELNKSYDASLDDYIYITPLLDADGKKVKTDHLLPFVINYIKYLLPWCVVEKWYTGASIIMNKVTFDKLGGWSEDYFMYSEDLDLFYKSSLMGIKVKELNAKIVHVGEGSTSAVWSEKRRLINIESSYYKFSQKYKKIPDYYIYRILCILKLLFYKPRLAWLQIVVMWHAVVRNNYNLSAV